MTDQENESIEQLNEEIETLKLKKEGLKIETENLNAFKENLEKQIDGNPEAEKDSIENLGLKSYKEKIEKEASVLKKIIDGDKESQDEIEKMGLKACKERLEIEINGNPEAEKDSIENLGLKSYKEKIEKEASVLKKIIDGDKESKDEIEKMGLKACKAKLEREIYSDLKKDENGNPVLSVEIKEILNKNLLDSSDIDKIGLEAYRKKLEREITGDPEAEKDSFEEMGLETYKAKLKKEIYGDVTNEEELKIEKEWFKKIFNSNKVNIKFESEIIELVGLKKYREILNNQINELRKKYEIAKDLSTLIKRSTYDKGWYYGFMVFTIAFLVLSSCFAYCYGSQIINEITKIPNRASSDYFGFFLMKMPFSLIIIAFISGAFIFINKLLFIIERINNQLRNFSKISVIASQMDNTYIDLIKNGNFSNGNEAEQNAHKEAEQKDLFYKLITNYLVSLSKNEADLADSKKEPLLKQVKQIAGIVKELNSFNKDK